MTRYRVHLVIDVPDMGWLTEQGWLRYVLEKEANVHLISVNYVEKVTER
jgi:hypothetical protein